MLMQLSLEFSLETADQLARAHSLRPNDYLTD